MSEIFRTPISLRVSRSFTTGCKPSDGTRNNRLAPRVAGDKRNAKGEHHMSGNQNGGGGGCIVLSIGDERHTHALATKTENVLRPIRLAFELPAVRHEHHTNGGGGGCIR